MSGQDLNEEGASAAFALFAIMFLLLAVTMLAVDAGNLWVSRRTQIADTDAAALAVAQLLTDEPCSTATQAAAEQLIDDTMISTLEVTLPAGVCPTAGVVTVETTRTVEFIFAPLASALLGLDDGLESSNTRAASMAVYGELVAAAGVKPLAFCADDFSGSKETTDYAAVTANPVYRIYMDTPASPCSGGSGEGNLGIIDFDRGSGVPGTSTINEWIRTGSQYEVDLGEPGLDDEDCNAGNDVDAEWCQGRPRKDLSGLDLDAILCKPSDCPRFYVVIYSNAGADPEEDSRGRGKPDDGANVHYDVVALGRVVLRGYDAKGEKGKGDGDYVDLELVNELVQDGRLGAGDGGQFSSMGVRQCGVDGFNNCANALAP